MQYPASVRIVATVEEFAAGLKGAHVSRKAAFVAKHRHPLKFSHVIARRDRQISLAADKRVSCVSCRKIKKSCDGEKGGWWVSIQARRYLWVQRLTVAVDWSVGQRTVQASKKGLYVS